jgi:large subunit ribosomal protein L19
MNNIFNLKTSVSDKIDNYSNIIKFIEKESLHNNVSNVIDIKVGDIIKVEYNVSLEENKIRIENYEGLVISKQNKDYNKSIILRRNIKGVILEHIIPLYSPRIKSIIKKKESKVKRSKLFFTRKLSEKKIKNKLKFY